MVIAVSTKVAGADVDRFFKLQLTEKRKMKYPFMREAEANRDGIWSRGYLCVVYRLT
jgi:hypothetical protein